MSNRPGLDALLPKNRLRVHDTRWTYVFKTTERTRMFNGTIDFLPFDPNGRMVYIGSANQIEHAFIILVPRNQVGRAASDVGTEVYKNIAPMDARTARAVFVMLAHMLGRVRARATYAPEYPPIEKDSDISEYMWNNL